MIERMLQKNGKDLVLTANDFATAETFVAQSKAKLKQGWSPTGKPADAVKPAKALLQLGFVSAQFIAAFTPEEVDAVYKQLIRDEHEDLSDFTLRARPTRALLEYLMSKDYNLLGSDLSKAIKFICKDEAVATWVREVMNAVLAGKPRPELKKFATQQLRNFGARAEKPEPPKVAAGDETSLLLQIAANPKDDAPRLVYADFLTEQGIGWGEVIPLLLKPEPEYGTPEYTPHAALVEKQIKKHLKPWLEPIRPFLTGWSVNGGRGLLNFVDTQPGKFIEAAEAISLRAPRGQLNLGGLKAKDMAALAATPLGRFAQVSLSQQRIDDAQLKLLAGSPRILGVEKWSLGENHFGDEGYEALAASPNFARCTELHLEHTVSEPIAGSAGLTALLSSKHWPGLHSLTTSVLEVGAAFDTCVHALQWLQLNTTGRLDDGTLQSIAKATSLQGLTALSLTWNTRMPAERRRMPFSEPALLQLVEALPKLRHLAVPGELPASVAAVLKPRI